MRDFDILQEHKLSQIRAFDNMHIKNLFMPDDIFTEDYLSSRQQPNQ